MILMLFLVLCAVCLGHLGLGARANLIVSIVLLIVGALVAFSGGFDGFSVRVD